MRRGLAASLVAALRPKHWVKNVFVFAPLVFAEQAGDPLLLARAVAAFLAFCALSSSVYLLNDVADREADRLHPEKRRRPIAAGDLSVGAGITTAAVLATGGLAGAGALSAGVGGVAGVYLVQNLLYSFALKRVVILDVMMVSAGFLLRTWAGAIAVEVAMSEWLVLCTGLLALFLGFVKRRQEIASMPTSSEQRPILREYSLPFLDQMIGVVTGAVVTAYALYAFSDEVAAKLGTPYLGVTIPFVLYGIFRYLYLVHRRGAGENPTALVLSDAPLVLNLLLWGGTVVLLLYVWRSAPGLP